MAQIFSRLSVDEQEKIYYMINGIEFVGINKCDSERSEAR